MPPPLTPPVLVFPVSLRSAGRLRSAHGGCRRERVRGGRFQEWEDPEARIAGLCTGREEAHRGLEQSGFH